MLLLHIETSTTVCSVAASEDGVCLIQKINTEGLNHARLLSVFIQEVLDFLKTQGKRPDAVALSQGPGSYTGLRIGTATAKGLCFGWEIPLIAIDTLQVMAVAARQRITEADALLCPMIDARRMEVYSACYDMRLQRISEVLPVVVTQDSYADILENHSVWFFGNGAEKCRTVLTHPNARFLGNIYPEAANMIILAEQRYAAGQFENVAYFDPFYLKEFQATTPKRKVL